ncbi:hypothetical protein D187_003118 [Cystobacter fuscus DSM 2262]|uniref:histidine kinase n=1 Tax=Cystobacter fuscus (strain ATCC 25194 / DSM 2262 / NBRC 100088 / M29) TaxID=1242864 RepID=S9QD07_CYSF2|nr:PAS domain-containing protein [Cystobacter fuscus]EPX59214.1 hypothetical protein D187_003118 [Cystobacter fuscus DSM 2262]
MSSSQADELRLLRAEVERLRGLLHRGGIDPNASQEASYRRIVESAIDFAVIALDLEGRVTHWNEGARRILGWPLERIRGEPAAVFFTEEDRSRGIPELEMGKALAGGRAIDERWHQREDGSRFWASGEMMPLKDERGTPIGFVKILRDRTPQKRLEEERERFILLAEQSTDFVCLADTEGLGLFINQAGRRMVGLPEGDIRAMALADFFPPEERGFFQDVILPTQRAVGHWRGRVHLQHQGTRALVRVDCNSFVLRDAAGRLTGYALLSRDITALEQAESALRRSDERLQLALKASGSVGIWDWDILADKLYQDTRCARLFSVAPEVAAAGAPLMTYLGGIHPEDRERVGREIQRGLDKELEFESEYRVTPGGEVRWIQVRGRIYRDEQGRPARFPGIVIDLTERKRAELRQRSLLELSDRLRNLSGTREIAALGSQLIGRTLGLSRVGFALVDVDTETLTVEQDWSNGQVAGIAGGYPFAVFGSALELLRRGQSLVETDAETAEWIPLAELPNYRALDMRGFAGLPLLRNDRLVGFVYAHSSLPRAWQEADVGFIREVSVRTWEAIERAQAEQWLRESEQDLRQITDQAPEMIGYVDRDLVYRFVNRTYEEWFARPLDRIIGKSALELLGEEAFALREPYFRRALAGEATSFEAPLFIPGRSPRELELRFFPRRDLRGNVQGVYLFILDNTDRKRAERALLEANKRLELRVEERTRERDRIWNHSDDLMGVLGTDGFLKSINPAWSRLLGVDEQTLLMSHFLDLVHPDDHAAVGEIVASLSRGERVHRMENRLRRVDGSYRFLSWTAVPGDDKTFYAIGRDVSAERETAALQQRLFDVLDQSPDFIGIAEPQGRILYVNASGRRMVGLSGPGGVGVRTVLEFFSPGDRPLIEGTVLPTALREGKWVGRCRFRHLTTGVDIPVEYNVFATRDGEGRLLGLGMVTRDITRQLQHEQTLRETEDKLRQSQKMEAVGQLTGGIAHDFNNLLGGIIGSMEMLRRRIEAGRYSETDKYINATMNSARRAAALTARLLAFGRRQSLDVKPTDINALVTSMAELLRRTLGESISLKTMLDPALWQAKTDANQFENALLNLAINARDAMPQGGKLTVETRNTRLDEAYARGVEGLKPGDFVVMCVSDTGHGMPPEVIARAFEPFFTTKPIGQGTGLGLSMIYGFARQVDGHVRIYSEVGRGTTIKLYMPRHVGEGAQAGEVRPELTPLPRAQEGETVLVVEDDPAVRMLVLEILEDLGYAALEAKDARSALPILEGKGRIDLLVTDVGLPGGMNGRQMAEVARQCRPELQVLFITGYAEGASVRGGFLAPGMEMITKPFALDVLAARIREMIERKQAPHAPDN